MPRRQRHRRQSPPQPQPAAPLPRRDLGWRFHAAAVVILILLGSAIYSQTLDGPFVFDDIPNISENPLIRVTDWDPAKWYAVAFDGRAPRPIAYVTLALNYYFHGYDVTGYHVVNTAIHLVNGLLVYWLSLATYQRFFRHVRSPETSPDDRTIGLLALFSAAIFVAHPLQTQAVTYIVQRMASLVAMFYLLSLALYVQGRKSDSRRWLWWIGSLLSGVLALGVKQNAATLPIAILLYEWFFFQDLSRDWARRQLKTLATIALVLGLMTLLYIGDSPWQHLTSGFGRRDYSMLERVMTQFRVVVFYLSLVLLPLPSRLNLLHDVPISHSLIDPITTLFSLLILLGLFALAVYWAKRERLLSFGILWFFLNLAIESSVVPLEIIFEHRNYLPLFGAALVVPYALHRALTQQPTTRHLVAVTLVLLLSAGTMVRNQAWQDSLTLWSDVIAKHPQSHRAYVARGDSYKQLGNDDLALVDYAKSIEIKPDYATAYLSRAEFYRSRKEAKSALANYSQAIEQDPKFQRAYMSRGDLLMSQGKIEAAIDDFSEAIRLAPNFAAGYNNRGIAHGRLQNYSQAYEDFATAIEKDPDSGQAYFNRATFYAEEGKYQQAVEDFSQTIALQPDVAQAFISRGSVYERLGELNLAKEDYQEATRIAPKSHAGFDRLAWLLATTYDDELRDGPQAIEFATLACELSEWNSITSLETLAAAHAESENYEQAIEWQTKATNMAPIRRQPPMIARLELYREGLPFRFLPPNRQGGHK